MMWILGNLRMVAVIGAVLGFGIFSWYLYDRGRDAEKAAVVEKIQDNIKVSKHVQNRNRSSSNADITKRLSRWKRD